MSAIQELRNNPDFHAFRLALGETTSRLAYDALSSPVEQRIETTSYARAVRDLWVAIEAAATTQHQRAIKPPRIRRGAEMAEEAIL